MRRLGLLAAVAVASVGVVAPAATADPCTNYGPLNTGKHSIGGLVYVDDRDYFWLDAPEGHGGIWIYLESNGEPGLQRGGNVLVDPIGLALGDPGNDPCQESNNPDTNIF